MEGELAPFIRRRFDSLFECLQFVFKEHPPGERVQFFQQSPAGLHIPCSLPRFLYRGESALYPTTEASLIRLRRSASFTNEEMDLIQRMHDSLVHRFRQEDYDQPVHDSVGLLQHYGFPTRAIDFTESPDIAAAFAVSELSRLCGRLCVMEVRPGLGVDVADYTGHHWAARALEQKAFAVIPEEGLGDLKSQPALRHLGVAWYEFSISSSDISRWRPLYRKLVDVLSDPSAGMLRSEIYHYVNYLGRKLPHKIAEWLVSQVPMVPRPLIVRDFDVKTQEVITWHLPPSSVPFDDDSERRWTLREWSDNFSDSSAAHYGVANPQEPRTVFCYPATLHGTPCPPFPA